MRRALGVVLFLTGCSDIVGPRVEFTPPSEWRTWYAEVSTCAGIPGDFDRIRWYMVASTTGTFALDGHDARASWRFPHSIYLADNLATPSASLEDVVRHEMLHDLLGKSALGLSNGGHPTPPFGLCADL